MTNPSPVYSPALPKNDQYRLEVGPVGGDNHSIKAQLNRWAGEGWRLVSAVVVPVSTMTPAGPQQVAGLMWIMERATKPKASPDTERLALPVLETLLTQSKAAAPFLTGIMRDEFQKAVAAAEAFLGQDTSA